MDHRENLDQNLYEKELKDSEEKAYDDFVTINGKSYRVPYRMIKEVTFEGVSKAEMIDLEHAARLQYRLMLQDSIIRAKVEFAKQRIDIVYNPTESNKRKEKISLPDLIAFMAKEGINVEQCKRSERDFDYLKEMYTYQYEPPTIREHPPYGYTAKEWAEMKDDYYKKVEEAKQKGREKFEEFQRQYAAEYPEIFGKEEGSDDKKMTLKEKIFGKKKKQDKGFWFHGV